MNGIHWGWRLDARPYPPTNNPSLSIQQKRTTQNFYQNLMDHVIQSLPLRVGSCIALHRGHIPYWNVSPYCLSWVICIICTVQLSDQCVTFPEITCFNIFCSSFRNKSFFISSLTFWLYLCIPLHMKPYLRFLLNKGISSFSLGFFHQCIFDI